MKNSHVKVSLAVTEYASYYSSFIMNATIESAKNDIPIPQ
jgi:hypothetical protein